MAETRRLCWSLSGPELDRWIMVGPEGRSATDIVCDIILDGLPIDSNTIDLISCPFALQFLPVYDVLSALREFRRVLKPGGILRLCLPDFDRVVPFFQEDPGKFLRCWDWETTSGNLLTQIMEYGYARTLFNHEFTAELLRRAGFQEIRRAAYRRTDSPYAEIVELDSGPDESLFVEAAKQEPAGRIESLGTSSPGQIHLSWTESPSTSLTVVWKLPAETESTAVEYRRVGDRAWTTTPGEKKPFFGPGLIYRATMRNLLPDTAYE